MNNMDRSLCAVTARLLQASCVVAAWGLALSVVAISALSVLAFLSINGCTLPVLSWMGFAAVALVGVLERYLAFRLTFDAGLFKDLANSITNNTTNTTTSASLDALDSALQRLGLRSASGKPRALEDRVAGTRQMLQRHGIAVACQSGLLLLALFALLVQSLR